MFLSVVFEKDVLFLIPFSALLSCYVEIDQGCGFLAGAVISVSELLKFCIFCCLLMVVDCCC